MANIVYFEIPAEDVDRAKRFYHSLLGWKIEPTKVPMDPEMTSMQLSGYRNRRHKGSYSYERYPQHGWDV